MFFDVFRNLDAEVEVINDKPNGANINKNCGAAFPDAVAAELKGADIGIALDGDADRAVFCDEKGEVVISSRRLPVASSDIQSRMRSTPEYDKVTELLNDEYIDRCIVYGELLKTVSPTRIEPKRKHIHWILFDIYSLKESRYLSYNLVYQIGYHFKIPVVRELEYFVPTSMEHLFEMIEKSKKWCKRHRREGIVGKDYKNQVFFKEKIDLPKRPKLKRQSTKVSLPPMPEEKILRALQHAYDEIGEDNWLNKALAMPIVARHIATEAREHYYAPPKNFYRYYVETPIEKIRDGE